ncbi:MAG: DUF2460 domain-containing protein, partial [Parvibaculum sp.]
ARRGRLYGFRWRDRADWKSGAPGETVTPLDQALGTGDGERMVFPLVKTYVSGEANYTREIAKPVAGSVRVSVAGTEKAEDADFTVDHASGVVTFAVAPGAGESVTAGYEFDVPVRFDTDFLDINLAAFEAGSVPDIPVVEIRV